MPQLTYPRLDLDPAPETTAFRAVDAVLRADPVLVRVLNKQGWFSWRGDPLDDAGPALSTCPWLRITPQSGPSDWETEGQHRMPLVVGIELAVGGTNADQLANLWHAVRGALFPADPARRADVRSALQAAGITRGRITQPAFAIRKDSAGNKIILAGGTLELLLLIDT